MRHAMAAFRAAGAELERQYWLALLSEVYAKMERPQQGRHALAEARAIVAKTGERFWEAELHRLEGELALLSTRPRQELSLLEAESSFHQALEVARRQEAKSLELRAATSLARLWQQQGKKMEARQLLAEIYHWFTEGFDTKDLQEAKVLLTELSERQ
jgi:predicted ATPase